MKNITIFLAGVSVGALLFWGISSIQQDKQEEKAEVLAEIMEYGLEKLTDNEPQIEFFKSPEDCLGTYKYEVSQAFEPGYALAQELEYRYNTDMGTGRFVLFYNPNHKPYYDQQIITIPKGYCARHIGIYKYGYQRQKTAPIVQIMRK